MPQVMQVGTKVKYRDSAGKIRSATVVGVTNQSTLTLRLGRGASSLTVNNASKVLSKGSTVGWYQGGR